MIIKKKYNISKTSELIFAKRDASKIVNEYLIFSLMELGTNILKYAKKGEIWILEENKKYGIAALDRGKGIKDIKWALKKGTTTSNSLGLGLYQLSNSSYGDFEIFSSERGTIAIFYQFSLTDSLYLTDPYIPNFNGDFFAQKGKFFLFGDSAGHGRAANKTSIRIVKEFFSTYFSCILVEDFLLKLDKIIKQEDLRGAVLAIVEKSKIGFRVCGVGNIFIYADKKLLTLKDGVIGDSIVSISDYSLNTKTLILHSDGVDEKIVIELIEHINSDLLLLLCSLYYSERFDDKSMLILRRENV